LPAPAGGIAALFTRLVIMALLTTARCGPRAPLVAAEGIEGARPALKFTRAG
jgi:hypothetical protein